MLEVSKAHQRIGCRTSGTFYLTDDVVSTSSVGNEFAEPFGKHGSKQFIVEIYNLIF